MHGFGLEDSGITIESVNISLLKTIYPEIVMIGDSYGKMEKREIEGEGISQKQFEAQI